VALQRHPVPVTSIFRQLTLILVVVLWAKLPMLAWTVALIVFAVQQRRHVQHDELIVVRHPKLPSRRPRVVVVVDHEQPVVVEHQHVFNGGEREREHRVRTPILRHVARVVDVHEVGHLFLDEQAARIHVVEVDAEDLLEARRVREARVGRIALPSVALDDDELPIGQRREVADGVRGCIERIRERLARVLALPDRELADDEPRAHRVAVDRLLEQRVEARAALVEREAFEAARVRQVRRQRADRVADRR
jgi:hypothetical protein